MKTDELDYHLPESLIAQNPLEKRTESRLMVIDRNRSDQTHDLFKNISDYLQPGDCLVLNDTKVIPARFFLKRQTGGKIEGLFLDQADQGFWHVMLKNASRLKEKELISMLSLNEQVESDPSYTFKVVQKQKEGHWLLDPQFECEPYALLERLGVIPLPPYIHRQKSELNQSNDLLRYQTVYANQPGSVAAPTAGLHFSDDLIEKLESKGIQFARLTLHVGLGTFKPVSVDDLQDHVMHYETYSIGPDAVKTILEALDGNRRVIAVGTTSVRTLEAVAQKGRLKPASGQTNLFITPGYEFKVISGMITNFHLPKSTLLALVSAFAGLDRVKAAYQEAVKEKYRFFSYGDAMLLI